MTHPDLLALLKRKVSELGQAHVARTLGYSPSALSQVLSGKYQGDMTNMLTRVDEVYGGSTVDCPVLGEIPLGKCAEHRKRPFAATNPIRVRLYSTCPTCKHRR